MAIRKVAVLGHPVLRKSAEKVPVEQIKTEAFKHFLNDMVETMREYEGRGLAAPQIHESLRVTVLIWDFEPKKKPYMLYLINPVIEPLTTQESAYWEGCLSLPGLRGLVSRPNRIKVSALNEQARQVEFIAEGFAATVVQHECDHLDGVLYIDRMRGLKDLAFTQECERYHLPQDGLNYSVE